MTKKINHKKDFTHKLTDKSLVSGFTRTPSLVSGFTLVELVVVMGIIGILFSVIAAQVIPALTKGSDSTIKADLANVQTVATLDFFSLGRKYSKTGAAISGVDCSTLTTPDTIFANPKIQKALLDIKDQNRGIPLSCSVAADGSAYAIAVTLASTGKYWCVDSTGAQKSTYSTGLNDYSGQYGGTSTAAIQTDTFMCQ